MGERQSRLTVNQLPYGFTGSSPVATTKFMEKIKLQFMVVPEQLASMAYVEDPIRIKIADPAAMFLTGLLGESGRKLVTAGVEFYFEKALAEKLIEKNIAIRTDLKIETRSYWIKDNPKNPRLCPICDKPLIGCHLGEYCNNCSYIDGSASLTEEEALKHSDKIIR